MPRPQTPHLTEHELSIMKILWNKSPLTVAEILEEISTEEKPAYTSLLTAVRSMEKKGYLKHSQTGKAYFYSPLLASSKYKTEQLKRLNKGLFDGNTFDLAVNLFKSEKLDKKEIARLKDILEQL